MSSTKTVLITGASKGIGASLARIFYDKGFNVIGTCRNPEKLDNNNKIKGVKYLNLDLSNDCSIAQLINSIPAIDILINNAGSSCMSPVEETDIDIIKEVFQINFFGHISVIKGVLPKMRNKKDGLIINITSFAAHTPVPFSGVYASAKSAMETLSLALNSELNSFGIKVVSVAPVFVNTKIYQQKICDERSDYYESFKKVSDKRDSGISRGMSPESIAEKIFKIACKKKPGYFYAVGKNAVVLNTMAHILPKTTIVNTIKKKFKI